MNHLIKFYKQSIERQNRILQIMEENLTETTIQYKEAIGEALLGHTRAQLETDTPTLEELESACAWVMVNSHVLIGTVAEHWTSREFFLYAQTQIVVFTPNPQ